MTVNIIFNNVKIYNVGDRLDVVIGQDFQIELLDGPGLQIFTNKDPVLSLDADDSHANAMSLGESIIRFMEGATVVKDLIINVVNATSPNATTLGGSLGEPQPK